jgi:hypothetical protein
MNLEKLMRQCFVASTQISSLSRFEGYGIASEKIVVVLASNSESDDQGEDSSPGVRKRKPRPLRPPRSHAAKVSPPPVATGKGDCEDDGVRPTKVLR